MRPDQAARLSAEYGLKLGPTPSIRIDDRTESDRTPPFCTVRATFVPADKMVMQFGNLPLDDDVRSWLKLLKATTQESPTSTHVEFTLPLKSAHRLRRLATLVRRVSGRGRRYADPNFKWICPRVSASLNHFVDVLEAPLVEATGDF